MARQLTRTDHMIRQFDTVLRTLMPGGAQATRPSPSTLVTDDVMSEQERQHSAGLMRVNHTEEVCVQALYQGQSLTAGYTEGHEQLNTAVNEELDHLAWCKARLHELDSHTSRLDPLFYVTSFGVGAIAGRLGNSVSLGFVNAAEERVGKRLEDHMTRLPMADRRSRAVVEKIIEEEAHHAHNALEAGGKRFSLPARLGIRAVDALVSRVAYRL
ncbi:2-polyprenyl-3-methyl-6-methoxy-1,4-benzoquinone monooxygenase [Phytohalomonas tamaricis]|uniref:2-polyprenyl-3-methyl-6-methoxy-1,4-benzoquinone monooxygenase n=1 Tax=Phytohalomonas tamaricis TaxID=2081032 RepID=UPI000D0BCA15|nr:2-polyprenyl-3-methyl-6-methoxy-1,4-benzoquinone monooxygenase [Phytohalomonas tamaricis]